MSVSIKPLEDRIIVRTLEAEQTTASGLVIPDTAKEKPQEGEVLAVGPGRYDDEGEKRIPLDVKIGDTVEIVETRPLSRRKRWSLKRVVRQAAVV